MIFGRFGLLLAIVGIAAVASAPVEAMTLVVQKGEVLVNRGDGFRPITGSLEIEQGGTVVVQEGAAAEFVCADLSRRRWALAITKYQPIAAPHRRRRLNSTRRAIC